MIAEIWLRSRHGAPGIPAPIHPDEHARAWICDVLVPTHEVWVATVDDRPVGMMALQDEWVEQLYIDPEYQQQGHGARLLRVAQTTRAALALWAFVSNTPARRFYEAHGFFEAGPPSSDNEERSPAILYRWPAT